MVLDLRELVAGTIERVPFTLDGDTEGYSDDILSGTTHTEGVVENHAGYVTLTGTILVHGIVRCARCCREFEHQMQFPMQYKVAESLDNEEEDDYLILENGQLDLDEVVRTQVLTEMPYRFLCQSNCKGLCPKCGCDLNVTRCSCDTRDIDSRWAALNSFFDEK